MQKLNIALIGYGFMGRAHSNAYRKVNNFFDLAYRPVLKAACARDAAKVKAMLGDNGIKVWNLDGDHLHKVAQTINAPTLREVLTLEGRLEPSDRRIEVMA